MKNSHDIAHFGFIIIPVMSTIIMFAIEAMTDRLEWKARWIKTGWDLCVLALGLQGGFIVEKRSLNHDSMTLGFMIFLGILICGVSIAILRQKDPKTGIHALIAFSLGGLSLALPTFWAVYLAK
jgi:hypothetical protein